MQIITKQSELISILNSEYINILSKFDESYYESIEMILCLINIKIKDITLLDDLINMQLDKSLVDNTRKILISFTSGTQIKKSTIERIIEIITSKTSYMDYFVNVKIDLDINDESLIINLFFVEG